jgi:ADP-heptose:LPS heptosyltransferase
MATHLGRSAFLRFKTKLAFEFALPTFDPDHRQGADGSRDYLTRNSMLRQQVLQGVQAGQVKLVEDGARLPCLPMEAWATTDFSGKRVLFILPSQALGDCVGIALFLRSFRRRWPGVTVAVANSGSATDIFAAEKGVQLFPLLLSEKQLRRFPLVIDLGDMDGWNAIATSPVEAETVLLARFAIDPDPLIGTDGRPLPERPRFAILPLASSPLRTLPPGLTVAVARALAPKGEVSVLLNAYQGQSRFYQPAIAADLPGGVAVLPGFRTVGELLRFVAAQDYLVTADSGPAHLSKLFATPGTAIYTSAGAEVLQGRFRNLATWQTRFDGPHCTAPCGLARLRVAADGRVGCMGSLGLALAELPGLPVDADPALTEKLVLRAPVPCVAALADQAEAVVAAVLADIARRRLPAE